MNLLTKLRHYLDEHAKFIWPPIWVIFGLGVGLLCISYHNNELINIGVTFTWSLAYFVLGALIGMIFGVPNASSESKVPNVLTGVTNSSDTNVGTTKINSSTTVSQDAKKVLSSTNLTQISDWLTKVVIGAGLVELRELPSFILKVARKMATGVALNSTLVEQVVSMCAAIIIFNSAFGFISGYLLMRIIFSLFI
jgi:hypothetical protein